MAFERGTFAYEQDPPGIRFFPAGGGCLLPADRRQLSGGDAVLDEESGGDVRGEDLFKDERLTITTFSRSHPNPPVTDKKEFE